VRLGGFGHSAAEDAATAGAFTDEAQLQFRCVAA
jgi:hypothetical protein